jgi:hypothetical protein
LAGKVGGKGQAGTEKGKGKRRGGGLFCIKFEYYWYWKLQPKLKRNTSATIAN